eukprot:1071513-Prymnesium_polylepis.1
MRDPANEEDETRRVGQGWPVLCEGNQAVEAHRGRGEQTQNGEHGHRCAPRSSDASRARHLGYGEQNRRDDRRGTGDACGAAKALARDDLILLVENGGEGAAQGSDNQHGRDSFAGRR